MNKVVWKLFFAFNVTLLLLLAFSFQFVEPGSAAYVVSVLSLGLIVPTMAILAYFIWSEWEPLEVMDDG